MWIRKNGPNGPLIPEWVEELANRKLMEPYGGLPPMSPPEVNLSPDQIQSFLENAGLAAGTGLAAYAAYLLIFAL